MPCPAFHPIRELHEKTHLNGRLPLIDEYEGICEASSDPFTPDRETQFRCCNQGYSRGACSRVLPEDGESSMRYSVLRRNADSLELLWIEEKRHEPRRWKRLEYFTKTSELRGEGVTECVRAQAVAFSAAYMRRFPA